VVLQCGQCQKPGKIFSINLLQSIVTRNHGRKVVYQRWNLQRTFIYAKEYFSRNFRNACYWFISKHFHRFENFLTLPVSDVEAKCTFSLQKQVKNYQRSPTTQDRLNELATRSINCEMDIRQKFTAIIHDFADKSQENSSLMHTE